MSSKAFLLLFARLLMSSLFVWDGVVQLQSRRHGAIFRQRSRARARYRGLDLDTGASARRPGAARGFLQPMGRCCACPSLPRHRFWRASAGRRSDNRIHFYKNLAMTGGFLYVIAFGAGGMSIDRESA